MRCSKCQEFVSWDTIAATETEEEYSAYIHLDKAAVCMCTAVSEIGSYDGVRSKTKKTGRGPIALSKKEKRIQMQAVDIAMQVYYADGLVEGMDWTDVRSHDVGGSGCTCQDCINRCKICIKRKGVILGET